MDTREKIIDLTRAVRISAGWRDSGTRWKLVTGYFDVLTPDHVRGLQGGGPLMAAVLDPPDPLLPPSARAELAASLRVVDYVLLLGDAGLEQAIAELRPDEVIRAEMADRKRSQTLIEHVQRRHKA